MAIRAFQLTLAASAKRMSDVYGDGAGVVNPVKDVLYRKVTFQPEGADFYVGDSTVSTTNYGAKFVQTGNTAPTGSLENVRLSDLYAVGAGATVHIMAVPY